MPIVNLRFFTRLDIVLLAGVVAATLSPAPAAVLYVKADADGVSDGTGWTDAFTELQSALSVAAAGDELRVAVGTYRPSERTDPADPRSATFQLASGVAVYGGFAGTETSLTERAGLFEATILTGDLNADDAPITNPADLPDEPTRAENAYHVITILPGAEPSVLDGLLLTGGQATADFPHNGGGGVINDGGRLTARNCTFTANAAALGGGMLNVRADGPISDCVFRHNAATAAGGGLYNQEGDPPITRCEFRANHGFQGAGMANRRGGPRLSGTLFVENVSNYQGGGMYDAFGRSTLTDCTFTRNIVTDTIFGGGGLFTTERGATLTNCTFEGNTATGGAHGGGIYNWEGGTVTLTNCTFRDNSADDRGGGIFNQHAGAALDGCTLSENRAARGSAVAGDSAGITLTACAIERNTGQAVWLSDHTQLTVNDSRFVHNSTGIYVITRSVATVTDSAFLQNGRGIFDGGSGRSFVQRCTFIGNTGGGGMQTQGTVIDSLFLGNIGGIGGGLRVGGELDGGSVINCVIVGNRAQSGGGLRISSGTTVANCVVVGNIANVDGAGVYTSSIYGASITNSIISGNLLIDSPNPSPQIFNFCTDPPSPFLCPEPMSLSVGFSLIEGGWAGEGNIDADPRFVRMPDDGGDGWGDNPETPEVDEGANDDFGDLRLQFDSPCIDAGDSLADTDADRDGVQPLPDTDHDGNPRTLNDPATPDTGNPPSGGAIVDIGAFEFVLPGDLDFDYDLDLADYIAFLNCKRGPGAPFVEGCHPADLDHDGDVDLADLVRLQAAFTGPR